VNNIDKLFSTTVRISNLHCLDPDAIWAHSIEICIARVPIRKRDGYDLVALRTFADKLKNHMVPNGIVFLICYAPVEAKSRPFEVADAMVKAGFTHIDNIVIEKTWFPGKRSETNLVNSHEYVLHFCNGKVWKLDRTPIQTYLGSEDAASCPGNTWQIRTGSLDEAYPFDLAELLIRMTDVLPGSIVFDPFGGSTSGLKASLKLGHSYYGFETDEKRIKKCEKAVELFSKKGTFEDAPKQKETEEEEE
jgi:hypothetical protein